METAAGVESNFAVGTFLKSGRYLLALPMAIFGIEHFIYANFVTIIVPPWIPWHLFWAYCVGLALIAAGMAIMAGKYAYLAATLLGAMILAFMLLVHSRLLVQMSGDVYAASPIFGPFPERSNNAFKDLELSGAALIFAGTQSEAWRASGKDKYLTLGRIIFAVSIIAFGVLHFIYPAFAPGIPPMTTAISFFIPGQPFWSCLTGVALLVAGVCLFLGKKVRLAATLLGILILLFALLVWVPRLIAHPEDIAGANYLKDLGIAGGALILAGAFPKKGD